MKLELDAPNLGILEKRSVNKTLDSGFVSTFGPNVPAFEDTFAGYLGVKKAVSTQSGTAAIHIALCELGIGRGDEVIVPVLTFVATVNPVMYVGATPVFADVDIRTWNISPAEIEKNITKRTKAIIPVHLYGNPCAMEEIMNIARRHNLYVIEDATESLGTTYKGRHVGTFGDLGCFSFNGNKVITTGGGGMVVGNDINRLNHIKFLVNQARDESCTKGYHHPEIGFNYRMTIIEAALGLAQLARLNVFLKKKVAFNKIYKRGLGKRGGVRFQEEHPGGRSAHWMTCVLFEEGLDIVDIQKRLKEEGIPTRRVFIPILEFPPYKRYKNASYPNAYHIYERGLCLPSSTLNSEKDIGYACRIIKEILKKIKGQKEVDYGQNR